MPWIYVRESDLHRLVPYLDLDALRVRLIELCLKAIDRNSTLEQYRERVVEYSEGKRNCLPDRLRFRDIMLAIALEHGKEHGRNDVRWQDGYHELRSYFFNPAYWEFVGEREK